MNRTTTETNETTRKTTVGSVVRLVIAILIFALACSVFIVVIQAKREHRAPAFFGRSFFIVVTGSMEPDIHVGELLITREVSMETIGVGDDVMFVSLSGAVKGENVVHRVIEVGEDEEGLYLRTKCVGNNVADSDPVREDNFIGKAVFHSLFWGRFFGFITDVKMLFMIAVVIIVVPFFIQQLTKAIRKAKEEKDDEESEEPKEEPSGDGGKDDDESQSPPNDPS